MPQFGEIKKFILFLYKGQKTDILLVGQKEMFCDPYENETYISFEDSDLKINWKGVAKRGKGNIPPGEMKIRVLLSNDSKEYLESISQLFNTKKMSLDAIVKLHTEDDYQRVSTNTKIEKDEATNCEDANVEGQCGESDDDKDAKDNGDMDEEDDPRELVTTDKNQNVLPINQRSAVRKRQAPSRLNLEATQINVYEDLTTSKKAKPSSKQQKEIMSIAHKTASDRILSLDQLNDSFDDATTENGEKGHSSPQGKDMLDSTLAKILVECTNTPLGKQSPVSVGRKDNSLKRADCGSSCCQEKDAIIGELKLEIKFQKDLNKTFSMQTTVLTDVRELLLKFSSQQLISTPSQQLAPPSTSNSGNFLNYANQSSTSGNLTGHPKFVGGNCAQMPNSEMSDKIGSDSLGDTLSTIEDESDGQLYDHKSFPIPETVMRRLIKGPVTHFVSHLMDKLYTDQYLATHKMTDMGGSGVGSKRLAMNKHELQHIIDRVLDCGLVNLDGSLVNEKMVKNAISRKFNNSRAK